VGGRISLCFAKTFLFENERYCICAIGIWEDEIAGGASYDDRSGLGLNYLYLRVWIAWIGVANARSID